MEVYFAGNKKVNVKFNDFIVETDQAIRGGGDGTAPEPFALFLASLAACAGIYVKSFCDQRDLDSSKIRLFQELEFNRENGTIKVVHITIRVPESFPEKYHAPLIKVTGMCAVKNQLKEDINFNIEIKVAE